MATFKVGDVVRFVNYPVIHEGWGSVVNKFIGAIVEPILPESSIYLVKCLRNWPSGVPMTMNGIQPIHKCYLEKVDDYNNQEYDPEKIRQIELLEKIKVMWERQNYYQKHLKSKAVKRKQL